ncbi:MAG: electron transfer flavoprotein subunit beta/FixA family protein [Trueperaceae bacterium]
MKIVTVIRRVPDAEARVRVEGDDVVLTGAAWVLDGMDEYGVEEALRLRESGIDAEIVALAVGPDATEEALRTALAMGADRARLLTTDAAPDPLTTARMLAAAIQEEEADLVLVGGKQADWDSAALGPALAETLGWPVADWTTSLAVDGDTLQCVHDADVGNEALAMPLPAVVTTQQGLNDPRYPTLPNIMKAKRKELRAEPAPDASASVRTVSRTVEQRERRRTLIEGDPREGAHAIVSLLREAGA